MSRLPYRVCRCWSEDPTSPGSGLQAPRTPDTRGWHSGRFPAFPVELGLQFQGVVALRSVRVLCHEVMIPTRVDVAACELDPREGTPFPPYETAAWRHLGHFRFGSNEDKQFQARELKTVHLSAQAVYLRLLVGKCHVNPYNYYNQVALVAVDVIGDLVRPLRLLSPLPDLRSSRPRAEVDIGALRPPGPAALPAGAATLDPATAQRIKDLEARKAAAVANEEYDAAKRLKEEIVSLQRVASRLHGLETEKRQATAVEDYDRAKELKLRIDALRAEAAGVSGPRPLLRIAGRPRDGGDPLGASASYDDVPVGRSPVDPSSGASDPTTGSTRRSRDKAPVDETEGAGDVEEPRDGAAGAWERRLLATLGDLHTGPPGASPSWERLSPSKAPEFRRYAEAFGWPMVECLTARQWQLRDAALRAVALHLIDQQPFGVPEDRLFETCCALLATRGSGIGDPVAAVVHSAFDLLEALLLLEPPLPPSHRRAAVGPGLREAVLRAGDPNVRVQDAALQLLKLASNSADYGPQVVYQAVAAAAEGGDPKRGAPRAAVAQLYVTYLLLQTFGLHSEDNPGGLDATAVVAQMALPGLQHPHAEVRREAVNVAAAVAALLPERAARELVLAAAKPAQRRAIEEAISHFRGDPASSPGRSLTPPGATEAQLLNIRRLEAQIEALPDPADAPRDDPREEEEESPAAIPACQFCGAQDTGWDEAALDRHLEDHCQWLTACDRCGQVVEIPLLEAHWDTNCETAGDAAPGMSAACPLCRAPIPPTADRNDGWRAHLIEPPGCPRNPRPLAR